MPAQIRRVPLVLAAILTALALALSACGGSAAPAPQASATQWSFTDDLGKTVTLAAAPTKIAGLNDVLFALMNDGLKPVASFGWLGIANDPRFKGLDTSGVVDLGTSYGEINVEALAKAAPDVIVTNAYPTDSTGRVDTAAPLYGFKDLAQQKQVEAIAPIITITMGGSATTVIKRTTELAVALGASADSGPIAEGKVAFDQAAQRLTKAASRGLVTQAIYGEAANVYVAKAPDDPALRMYRDLGMTFVPAKTKDYYWDILSWEDYDTVGGDVVLYSERGFDQDQLMKQPTFAATPAAKAGQVHPWVFAGMDYVSQAAYMTQLADLLTSARKVA